MLKMKQNKLKRLYNNEQKQNVLCLLCRAWNRAITIIQKKIKASTNLVPVMTEEQQLQSQSETLGLQLDAFKMKPF